MNKNEIEYKGYTGSVEWSEDDDCFFGAVKGIRSSISYEGITIDELKKDFRDSVDSTLEFWKEHGVEPEIPYKGSFNVRIGSTLHKRLAQRAETEKTSINSLVKNAIIMYLEK